MNLPETMANSVKGFVVSNSMVPVWYSSENVRMVIAGIKNVNIAGAIRKSESREA